MECHLKSLLMIWDSKQVVSFFLGFVLCTDFIFSLQGFYVFHFSFYVLGLDPYVCLQVSFLLNHQKCDLVLVSARKLDFICLF
jgi:hypothetical protein